MYVLTSNLNERSIIDAIGTGHSFMAFEAHGTASWFTFVIEDDEHTYEPSDIISKFHKDLAVRIKVPAQAEIRLIRNGGIILTEKAKELTGTIPSSGVYRVEVYRGKKLWIVSNPIYVEQGI